MTGTGATITVSTCDPPISSFDTKISVYNGSDCLALECVTANNDACGDQSRVSFMALNGEEYKILVHGFGSATGQFELAVS